MSPTDPSRLAALVRRLDDAADGVPDPAAVATGFPSVDRLLGGGLRPGDLVILGGDVGSGKSALALAMAYRAAEPGADRSPHAPDIAPEPGPVTFCSGEMTPARTVERLVCLEGRARIDDVRRGLIDEQARAALGAAAVRVRDAALLVEPLPPGVEELGDTLRRALDLRLAVIDGLEHLTPGLRPRDEELAATVRRLKALALELEVPILVTAQVTHLARDRQDLRPRLEDFAALGAVREHADVILGLFREEMYAPVDGMTGATELLALKNRNGSTGYVDLYFYAHWLRFEDMLDPDR